MEKTEHHGQRMWAGMLGALGVVFGDIGTSPLYAFKESLRASGDVLPPEANIFGIVSLILWCIILVVSLKYVTLITRVNNQGEGGILALMALLQGKVAPTAKLSLSIMLFLFGSALLYGDGVITPAISVLSAVEGLEIVAPSLQPAVLPITIAILVFLFAMQRRGTEKIGFVFGPIMLLWFSTLGILGFLQIWQAPEILKALNPFHAFEFITSHGWKTTLTLGSVFLAVTGAEALYADMGHFGRSVIVYSWHWIAFPGLALNYLGQGALVLQHPEMAENPFFFLAPAGWFSVALVVLSTFATIIASQALITGVFSLTRQAIQLGYFPRVGIRHTSESTIGQIYIPIVNRWLGLACILMVLWFQSSERLVAAYGVAVSLTMVITTIAFAQVMRRQWHFPLWAAWGMALLLLCIDTLLCFSSLHKFVEGGYLPVLMALGIFTMMHTWKVGRGVVAHILSSHSIGLSTFIEDVARRNPYRVDGTAVFMTARSEGTPSTLLHFFKHTHVLHKQIILLHIETEPTPHANPDKRVELNELGEGFWRANVYYGYMEEPTAKEALKWVVDASDGKITINSMRVSYIFNREIVLGEGKTGLWKWQKSLLAFLCQLARPARDYFKVPANQIVELSTAVHL